MQTSYQATYSVTGIINHPVNFQSETKFLLVNAKRHGVGALDDKSKMWSEFERLTLNWKVCCKTQVMGQKQYNRKKSAQVFMCFGTPLPKTSLKLNRNIIGTINACSSLSCNLSLIFVFKIPYYCCIGLEERAGLRKIFEERWCCGEWMW